MRKRRTREISTVLFVFVLAATLFTHFLSEQEWSRQIGPITRMIDYLRAIPAVGEYLPPAIAADAITSLHKGEIFSALHGILYLCFWIAVITAIGYLVFSKLQLEERGRKWKIIRAAKPRGAAARTARTAVFDLAGLSPLPVETYAVVTKELRYIMRSAMGRSMIILVPCITVVHALMIREAVKSTAMGIRPGEFGLIVVSIYIAIVMGSHICNSFQWEGGGIQTYFSSPASLASIIAGKSLGIVIYAALVFCVSTVMWRIITNELHPLTLAAGFLIFANSILTTVIVGNILAIKYPVP